MTMEPGSSINLYFGTCGGNCSPYISSNWPTGTLENNKWVHIVWTKDPLKNQVVAYKNGAVVQSKACNPYCETVVSPSNIYLGYGYAGRFFGLLDDVRIFSEAFTQAQVQQLYADGLAEHQNLIVQQ